ncbi:MAG: hypothetical protein D8M58_11840 [Calditrichaeota bacterium]|nr:MAG: hypothetical protein DWQ03_12625 [Calditrichota bacterium]MBL1206087.1 hypothetical protein [Calditrichota bacterium]NOG45913.1 hypothetical protein [Calditrichota bacterium]
MVDKSKLTFVFTDSGLGGLSIMADFLYEIEKREKNISCEEIEIIFFNALPESGQGYNRMHNMQDKIRIFNSALEMIQSYYTPDSIAIACNTLSAIYPLTQFAQSNSNIFEIISAGRYQIEQHRKQSPKQPVFVLATPTTLASSAYEMEDPYVFQISGENLASLIEFDHTSPQVKEITKHIFSNIEKCLSGSSVKDITLFLGCTHYGYVEETLKEVAKDFDFTINTILNPNLEFTSELMDYMAPIFYKENNSPTKITLKIESQALIEPSEIESISQLIKGKSEVITSLLKNYKRLPKMF